jgi:hypothetical protein
MAPLLVPLQIGFSGGMLCQLPNAHRCNVDTITELRQDTYPSGAKYRATLIVAPANISVLNDVFAWCIVPLIAVGCF